MYLCKYTHTRIFVSMLALDFKIKTFIIKANHGTEASNPTPPRKDFERKTLFVQHCKSLPADNHVTKESPGNSVALSFGVL